MIFPAIREIAVETERITEQHNNEETVLKFLIFCTYYHSDICKIIIVILIFY